jgi:hypothetical protein
MTMKILDDVTVIEKIIAIIGIVLASIYIALILILYY